MALALSKDFEIYTAGFCRTIRWCSTHRLCFHKSQKILTTCNLHLRSQSIHSNKLIELNMEILYHSDLKFIQQTKIQKYKRYPVTCIIMSKQSVSITELTITPPWKIACISFCQMGLGVNNRAVLRDPLRCADVRALVFGNGDLLDNRCHVWRSIRARMSIVTRGGGLDVPRPLGEGTGACLS